MISKLQFFTYVASVLEPFSRLCQTDAPMIPFMYFNIKNLVTNILKLFVQLEVIEGCKTASDLLEIDLSMEKNLLKVNQISVGFATETSLSDLMKKDLVDAKKIFKVFLSPCYRKYLGGVHSILLLLEVHIFLI